MRGEWQRWHRQRESNRKSVPEFVDIPGENSRQRITRLHSYLATHGCIRDPDAESGSHFRDVEWLGIAVIVYFLLHFLLD